ncbi:DUF3558 family protein [Nocardia sp. NPDC057030]|uniref:DUF3558 family protein n=1 Tax=unclassified Nocardia TaxID=2637762 RepID=UPI00362E2069
MLVLTSCNDGSPTDGPASVPTTSVPPSLAVSLPPAPTQHNQGRQEVKIDPCLQVDDQTVTRAGFDPKSRKRDDQIFDTYSIIGCKFDDKKQVDGQVVTARSLTVWSTNVSLDEFRTRESNSATTVKVGNNDAIKYETPNAGACWVAMKDSDGVLNIRIGTNLPFTSEKPCDRIIETAEIISSAVH